MLELFFKINAHYRLSFKVGCYALLRLIVFPTRWMLGSIALKGRVLCLGCGYGVLETLIAEEYPEARLLGMDTDEKRIKVANESIHGLSNISFQVGDALKLGTNESFDAIVALDIIHHLPRESQESVLRGLWAMIQPGGELVLKDLKTEPKWKTDWAYFHDLIVAGRPINYRSVEFYENIFKSLGAEISISYPTDFYLPYNHFLLIARKSN
ncbi:MAG: class I SAM-dependent methyltransferase [bacterium]